MQPSMLLKLLRKLTVDVSKLSEYTTVALRVSILFLQQIHLIKIAKPTQFKQVKLMFYNCHSTLLQSKMKTKSTVKTRYYILGTIFVEVFI